MWCVRVGWCAIRPLTLNPKIEPQSDRRQRPAPCGRIGEHDSQTRLQAAQQGARPPVGPPPCASDRASQFPCTTSSTSDGISRKLCRNTSDGRRPARRDTTAGACGSVRRRGYSHQLALCCAFRGVFTRLLVSHSVGQPASQPAGPSLLTNPTDRLAR